MPAADAKIEMHAGPEPGSDHFIRRQEKHLLAGSVYNALAYLRTGF